MNINKLLRFADIFYSLASSEELPSDSKDLPTILKNIAALETYTARKDYAEKNLKHLSSGSSRIVYLSPKKTIIKISKNEKGIAQNRAEANPKMKSKYLNEILGHASNYVWIETYYLDKITTKDFEKMTGLKFEDFGEAIRYGLKNVSENSDLEKPENFDKVEKSSIYKEMKKIGSEFRLMPGDIARISSWGTKDGRPILIDAGLTSAVFSEFYEESSTT
jgi:hypothetical protein